MPSQDRSSKEVEEERERVEPRALLSGLRPHEGRPFGAPASLRLPGCPAAVTFRRITHMGCRTLSHRHMASKPLSLPAEQNALWRPA